ncbi:MAG: leucine-rich repeat domain-containing protein [Oscillospiraceae bacterium]|nr:leucine-rich repeat domain-containing protein [Oscillospiraceae bacterium]
MKYYRKPAAFAMGMLIAFSAAVPSFTAFAEDDEFIVVDDDGNVIKNENTDDDTVYESGGFKYTLSGNDATITSSASGGEEFTLPSEIDGHRVVSVTPGAFQYLNAKKVIIPADSECDLSENPFAPCILLKEYEVEEGNSHFTSKDGVLFSKDMKKLISYPAAKTDKSYSIPEGTEEINTAAFYMAPVESLEIPSSVKKLNRHCFAYLKNVKKMDLSSVDTDIIPAMTFAESDNLSEVVLPDSLTKIEVGAFMNCPSLTEITLPEGLESIGQSAFMGSGLTTIVVPDSVSNIAYNALGYKDEETAVENFTIVGSAGTAAAIYASDEDPEYGYKNDFKYVLRENYERQLQFEAMNVQETEDYSYAVNDDGTAVLVSCSAAGFKVEVPDSFDGHTVTSVFAGAFQGCFASEIIFPDTITKFGSDIFAQTVQTVTLPGNLAEFGEDEPFLACTALKSISVGEGNGAFSAENGVLYNKDKTNLICYPQAKEDKKFTVPESVKNTVISACCYNTYLEELDLSDVEVISDYSFEGCTALKSIKMSKKLKSVGQNAFLGCSSLTSIRVYKTVESIGQYAFGYNYDDDLAADIRNNPEKYADTETGTVMPYSVIDGFRMYVDKGSLAEQYADDCGIEKVTNAAAIGSTNFDARLLYGLGGIAGIGIIGVIIKTIAGKAKKKKK